MKKQVVITGGSGIIATIIFEALKDIFSFTLLDVKNPKQLPYVTLFDVANDYEGLKSIFKDKDAIIHLAWDTKENWRSGIVLPINKLMAENVYKAAVEVGVPRVIIASSVHADKFGNHSVEHFNLKKLDSLMNANVIPTPNNPYGASKVYIEALGRCHASKDGLEVICVRFGGTGYDQYIDQQKGFGEVWLSKRDCANLVTCCLQVEKVSENFEVFNGVSDNGFRVHDWKNSIGWVPMDDSLKFEG